MRFLARALGWATLFVLPCWLASPPWQRFLARAASVAMAKIGFPWYLRDVDLLAPGDIGIFLALVLASLSAPRRARVRAGLAGVGLLIVLEVITAILITFQITLQQPPRTSSRDNLRTLIKYVIDSALLWSPIVVWLLLLGRFEVPALFARRVHGAGAGPEPGKMRVGRRPPVAS